MNYNLAQYPISPATDYRTVLSGLGYFWNRIFSDKTAISGLTQSMTSGAEQNYTDILDIIDSYSAQNLPIFNRVNWYSFTINRADLNQTLVYGEGPTYKPGTDPDSFAYGDAFPAANGVYSVLAPEDLKEISIVADRIITPTAVWVSGQNVQLKNGRLYFQGSPLPDGVDSITLWFYNAGTEANNLYNNVGYLFGLHVDSTEQGKAILSSSVNLLANGASIDNLKQVCVACLNLMHADDTTINGRINIVDRTSKNSWWTTDYIVSPGGVSVNLPLYLPPTMFLANYKGMLRFDNTAEPIHQVTDTNYVQFPVQGSPRDVRLFNDNLNSDPTFLYKLNKYLGGAPLSAGDRTINPLQFLFDSVLGSATTLMHVIFNNLQELYLFQKVFGALKNSLPKHVWLLVLCEVTAANEVYALDSQSVESFGTMRPVFPSVTNEAVTMNGLGGPGLSINDMLLTRTLPANPSTVDYNNLSFTKSAV